jgi:hypothetical protein
MQKISQFGKIVNPRNILILFGILVQVIAYVLLVIFMLQDINTRTRDIDYTVIYSAGYIARFDSLARVYDLDAQRQVQENVLGLQGITHFYPYNHPPFLLPFLVITTSSDYVASFLRWVLLLVIIYSLGLMLLLKMLHDFSWNLSDVMLFGIVGFLFYPIFASYLKGQDSAIFMLGVSLWVFGLFTKREWVAGLGLGLTLTRPQAALFLAIPFLFRQRKVWWGFLISGVSLLIISLLLVGFNGLKDFFNILLLSSKGYGFDANVMVNLKGALIRFFPGIKDTLVNTITYSGYALAMVFLSIWWAKSPTVTMRHVGVACLLYMFFTPHIHSHDWSLLVIPSMLLMICLLPPENPMHKYSILIPLGASIYLMIFNAFIQSPLAIDLLLLGMGILFFTPTKKPILEKVIAR